MELIQVHLLSRGKKQTCFFLNFLRFYGFDENDRDFHDQSKPHIARTKPNEALNSCVGVI